MDQTTTTIQVKTRYIAPVEEGRPGLAVHVTQLVGSYMVWVGVTDVGAERVGDAPLFGHLCRDWACAMPGADGAATTVYRTSGSDVALSMAQRLARRVGQQVFLSVDGLDGRAADAERGIVDVLLNRP